MCSKIIGISRHRIDLDGQGIVTLVTFSQCPLNCLFCLNPECHYDNYGQELSETELYNQVKIDNLYFIASGGGVTFGGGEPLLNYQFISRFKDLCHPMWKINVETCLNIPTDNVFALLDIVDYWIIDIKDMNPLVYMNYTGKNNDLVIQNLKLLSDNNLQDKCLIRIPLIPRYNSYEDIEFSKATLIDMGFHNFNVIRYELQPLKDKLQKIGTWHI